MNCSARKCVNDNETITITQQAIEASKIMYKKLNKLLKNTIKYLRTNLNLNVTYCKQADCFATQTDTPTPVIEILANLRKQCTVLCTQLLADSYDTQVTCKVIESTPAEREREEDTLQAYTQRRLAEVHIDIIQFKYTIDSLDRH